MQGKIEGENDGLGGEASFAKIRRLLEISDQDRHHEVLLTMNNLHDLSRHPSPYIVPIIPCPLPS